MFIIPFINAEARASSRSQTIPNAFTDAERRVRSILAAQGPLRAFVPGDLRPSLGGLNLSGDCFGRPRLHVFGIDRVFSLAIWFDDLCFLGHDVELPGLDLQGVRVTESPESFHERPRPAEADVAHHTIVLDAGRNRPFDLFEGNLVFRPILDVLGNASRLAQLRVPPAFLGAVVFGSLVADPFLREKQSHRQRPVDLVGVVVRSRTREDGVHRYMAVFGLAQHAAPLASVAGETVISLSGGLDSRSVIAGYTHVDGRVTAATSARKDGGKRVEVDVARQVARALGIPWRSYLADRTPRHRAQLFDMTQGMNNLGRATGLDFVEQVAAEHDDPMFVTGDGLSISDRQPRRQVDTEDALVDALIIDKEVFSIEDVTALLDVTRREIVDSVRERVAAYPENTLDGKHLHYYFRERSINWLNHGEDRTRYYLWSTTPAYAPAFFAESMDCPPEQKRGSRLSRAFLTELAPPVVKIDYVDYKAPIDSLEYRVKRYAYEWLLDHPELKHRILPIFDRKDSGWDGNPPRELVYARDGASEVGKYVSMEEVQRITWSGGKYSSHQQNLLLTVVGAVSAESGTPIVPADG